ncbi:hypothetical protein IGI04_040044 [Brassica rapa subsp. trilocularis]|uniref:Uncharacterized protein n=1 Tax=Brassica rapa subsp. trilocularis TaxID=1813537 RepID=A0ABQ7KQY3_BRACM|nr:hypothetical protein IGI04_040044 [Brassica rapa subsp. trilocularis]
MNNLTKVRSSERTDQTDRAVPRASGLELRLEPRPDDRTDRTTARLPRQPRHSKTHARAILTLGREGTEDRHAFLSGGPSEQSRQRPYLYPVHPSALDRGYIKSHSASLDDPFIPSQFQKGRIKWYKSHSTVRYWLGGGRQILLAEEKSSLGVVNTDFQTNSLILLSCVHLLVKMFETDQRRLFSQFEVREFCDNLLEGVVKALKDVTKIQKKRTTTRAPVAKPSLFINKKPKGKYENNIEDLKDFSDSLPIFDEYGEELMESLIICEDECDLRSPKSDFMFNDEETNGLTCFEPKHPSSLVLISQDFEEEPIDYSHQGSLLGTRRPMDVDLCPIYDEEDELGPAFDEKPLSITPFIMENRLCFDPDTTPTPLSKEHCKELCIISYVPDLFDKVSYNEIKLSGLDHLENSFELDLQQLVFCSRKSFDSFVFKENSFSVSSYRHELITGILFASSYALDDFMVSTLLEHNSHRAETDFCGDSVLKSVYSYSESDLELLNCAIMCPDTILVYNTYFDRLHDDLKRLLHDKHDQSPGGVRNRSRDLADQFEIWRCIPPEKLEMANLLSDEPTINSVMPKVNIHVLDVQESLGLMVFQNIQKQTCLGQMEKPIKYWLREKMDFDQASKGHVLAHIRSIFFTFQSLGRGYIKRQSKFQSKTLFSQVFVSIFIVLFLAHFSLELYNLLAPSKLIYFVGLVRYIKHRIETLLLLDLCVISSNN